MIFRAEYRVHKTGFKGREHGLWAGGGDVVLGVGGGGGGGGGGVEDGILCILGTPAHPLLVQTNKFI